MLVNFTFLSRGQKVIHSLFHIEIEEYDSEIYFYLDDGSIFVIQRDTIVNAQCLDDMDVYELSNGDRYEIQYLLCQGNVEKLNV